MCEHTAGVDEAGRGCLAGPVVAAAVILPEQWYLPHLHDSKQLSKHQRHALAPCIRKQALAWSLGVVWQKDIDTINILQATFVAMAKAVASLKRLPALLLIDGNKTIPTHIIRPQLKQRVLPTQQAIVGGDALDPRISAASILAKTFRDTLMAHLHKRYPHYGFDQHKGYGTKHHKDVLRIYGACPIHRMTFAGVKPTLQDVTHTQNALL